MTTSPTRYAELVAFHAAEARKATSRRDRMIRNWRNEHATSLRTIGEAAGLSHTAVAKIIERAR